VAAAGERAQIRNRCEASGHTADQRRGSVADDPHKGTLRQVQVMKPFQDRRIGGCGRVRLDRLPVLGVCPELVVNEIAERADCGLWVRPAD